jgi:tetratricopeptide (TPR) repeat protein
MARLSEGERLKQRMQSGQDALAAGELERAATEWSAALRSARRLPVAEDLRTTLQNNLAALYHSLGRNLQARRMYGQALSAAEQQHGPQSQPVATILNNLAELERSSRSPARAEPLFRKALAILEQAPGGSHQQIAGVLANTAECLREQGKLEEATALSARALSLLGTSAATSGPTGLLLNNMAQIEDQRGNYWEAVSLHQRALASLEQAGASFEAQRRTALANYAKTLRNYAASIEQRLGPKPK